MNQATTILTCSAALPNQRQARVGGQVELGGLLDFEARHGRLGE